MKKIMRLCNLGFMFIVMLLIATSSAFAKGKPGGSTQGGFGKGEKKGWHGGSKPPGWTHGKKKGWDGAGTPPGLAKKS